jgi:hypothetical protein
MRHLYRVARHSRSSSPASHATFTFIAPIAAIEREWAS